VIATPKGVQGGQWLWLEEKGTLACDFFGAKKLIHRFSHLSAIKKTGIIKEGEIIATSGNSGLFTTSPHTHHDISKNEVKLNDITNFIDPEEYFNLYLMAAPEWFIKEGYYDRAKKAEIKGIDELKPMFFFEQIAATFKIVDEELNKNDPPYVRIQVYKSKINPIKFRIIQDWFLEHVSIGFIFAHKEFDDYGWAKKTTSVGNRPTKKWLEDNLSMDADVILLCIPNKKWKRKKVAGYAPENDVIDSQLVLVRESTKSASTAHPDAEIAIIIHELVHTFHQMAGVEDKTHYYDFEVKDLAQALAEIPWANI